MEWNRGSYLFPRYQAGHLSLIGESLASLRIASDAGEVVVDQALVLPDVYQVTIQDIAVGFDGQVAIAGSAIDKEVASPV
ncbi:MAG: hypothetical protein R2724_06625 [Bryobacterales bacterium]